MTKKKYVVFDIKQAQCSTVKLGTVLAKIHS